MGKSAINMKCTDATKVSYELSNKKNYIRKSLLKIKKIKQIIGNIPHWSSVNEKHSDSLRQLGTETKKKFTWN